MHSHPTHAATVLFDQPVYESRDLIFMTSRQASKQWSRMPPQPALLHCFRLHLWPYLASTAASSCPWTPTADRAQHCAGCPHAAEVDHCCSGVLALRPLLRSGCCWSLEHGHLAQRVARLRICEVLSSRTGLHCQAGCLLSWSQAAAHLPESCPLLTAGTSDRCWPAEGCHLPAEKQRVRLCCGEGIAHLRACLYRSLCWTLAARPQS